MNRLINLAISAATTSIILFSSASYAEHHGDKAHYRDISETNLTQDKFDQILCPNLRVGVRMGLLNPDSEGWVKADEVRDFLTYIGVAPKSQISKTLVSLGESSSTSHKEGWINITDFKGGFLDHGSSSGILNNPRGFSEQRLELLKSFSKNGTTLTTQDLAIAATEFNTHPVNYGSFLGTSIQSLELATLLRLYGKKDSEGNYFFTLNDVDALWKANRFPDDWHQPEKSNYGTWGAIKSMLSLVWDRLWN